ncbi:MAG TPA: hypothetical protein VE400_26730 [Mycobacterium sp.]|nr:hypothetical protein [Mycobacterium sp.]
MATDLESLWGPALETPGPLGSGAERARLSTRIVTLALYTGAASGLMFGGRALQSLSEGDS